VTSQDQQVAAGAIVEDGAWLGKLHGELRGLLAPVFAQARSRLTAFAYVGALLAERGDRRSCWQLAEVAGHATPRRMQALLAEHAWDWKAALAALQRFILAHLGDPEAIVVLDETAELKKGTTVGVARQHAARAPLDPRGGQYGHNQRVEIGRHSPRHSPARPARPGHDAQRPESFKPGAAAALPSRSAVRLSLGRMPRRDP
jgi:hypothetical protein